MATTRVLRSKANPEGWLLEDLLAVLISDLEIKNAGLVAKADQIATNCDRQVHARVSSQNAMVRHLLMQCRDVQMQSVATLALLGTGERHGLPL